MKRRRGYVIIIIAIISILRINCKTVLWTILDFFPQDSVIQMFVVMAFMLFLAFIFILILFLFLSGAENIIRKITTKMSTAMK